MTELHTDTVSGKRIVRVPDAAQNTQAVIVSDVEEAYRFVCSHVPLPRSSNLQGIVQQKDGETISAVLFADFNGTNIFVHLAGKPGRKWMTRSFLYWMCHYPFVQLRCKRATCWVESGNVDSIRFTEHFGWTLEATLVGAGSDGQDVYIYKMLREDCRYV